VPRTACWAALIAACLNLITEIFGADQPPDPANRYRHPTPVAGDDLAPKVVRMRAMAYFGWLAGFIALVASIGFLPAIALFVFIYMWLGFGESWLKAAIFAVATVLFCWTVFDRGLAVPWPQSILGNAVPALRSATALM
jgi:hypothetical protein